MVNGHPDKQRNVHSGWWMCCAASTRNAAEKTNKNNCMSSANMQQRSTWADTRDTVQCTLLFEICFYFEDMCKHSAKSAKPLAEIPPGWHVGREEEEQVHDRVLQCTEYTPQHCTVNTLHSTLNEHCSKTYPWGVLLFATVHGSGIVLWAALDSDEEGSRHCLRGSFRRGSFRQKSQLCLIFSAIRFVFNRW